jgi:hypothetical protein
VKKITFQSPTWPRREIHVENLTGSKSASDFAEPKPRIRRRKQSTANRPVAPTADNCREQLIHLPQRQHRCETSVTRKLTEKRLEVKL